MVMATFGFSVGDFIAAIELVAKVAGALQDTGGAAAQYQSLARDLINLQIALLKIGSLHVEDATSSATIAHDQTLLVQQSVKDLLEKIAKFDKSLGYQAKKKGWRHETGRKVEWALFQSREVSKLRDVVTAQVQNLGILNELQILEAIKRNENLLRATSNNSNEKLEATKDVIIGAINQLSSAHITFAEDIRSRLNSSFGAVKETVQSSSQSNATRFTILDDAIQEARAAIELLLNNAISAIKSEGQAYIVDFGCLNKGLENTQRAVADLYESNHTNVQVATRDIRQAILDSAMSTAESHANLLQITAKGLETNIIKSFTSVLEQHARDIRNRQGRAAGNEAGEQNISTDDENTCPSDYFLPIDTSSSESNVVKSFYDKCLAVILAILYASFRRIQLSLVLLLPAVSALITRLFTSGILTQRLPQLLENSIRFEDALGRVSLLPYEHFQHWEMFKTMLKCKFKGFPGEQNVKAGMYFILRARRPDQVITQELWQRLILPGADINMSMIVSGMRTSTTTCPRCKTRSSSVSKAPNTICSTCDLEYHKSELADLENRQDAFARRFLQLLRLWELHDASDSTESPNHFRKKLKRREKASRKVNFIKDFSGSNSSSSTRTETKHRLSDLEKDIEAFKRIHMLIDEADSKSSSTEVSKEKFWSTSSQDEREHVKLFWLSLSEEDRRSLVKVEKEAVLKKMKDQQKHSCRCAVCGRKRDSIEKELEILYDSYYEELEQYAERGDGPPMMAASQSINRRRQPSRGKTAENFDNDDEGEEINDEEYSEEEYISDEDGAEAVPPSSDFFSLGQSLRVKSSILTVSEDLLKNDGKKFIEMMGQLAERRMAREESASEQLYSIANDYDDEGDDEDNEYDSEGNAYDNEDIDITTEEDQGRRIFQIFAARMFEQRVLTAYKEKVAIERQEKLLREIEEEAEVAVARKARVAEMAQKRRERAVRRQAMKDLRISSR